MKMKRRGGSNVASHFWGKRPGQTLIATSEHARQRADKKTVRYTLKNEDTDVFYAHGAKKKQRAARRNCTMPKSKTNGMKPPG